VGIGFGVTRKQWIQMRVTVTCTLAILAVIFCVPAVSILFGDCPWCGTFDNWVIVPSELFSEGNKYDVKMMYEFRHE
jgi:hypothetical protein